MNFTDSEIEDLLKGVFAGDITKENLPVDLYQSIAQFLEKGLLSGAGGPITSFDGKDLDLIQELRTNIYMFSAAKTYQEVRGMTDLLYNEDDKVKPFDEFFEDARALYNNYNVNYAQTEYNTAVASGQMGVRWNQIEADKDVLPLLKMTVVEDAQTTEICEPLDGITLPVNDPFWDEFYPPNHWNCRSTVLQLDEGDISSKAEVDKAKEHAEEDMQDVFRMNVGKDEIVFSPDHPYFKVPREDKELAKRNFDLPMPADLTRHKFEPKEFAEWGVKLDDRLYDLLKSEIKVKETQGGACANLLENTIKINIKGDRWNNSDYYKEKVLYHEVGHIIHSQQKLIFQEQVYGRYTQVVSEKYATHFNSLKKMVKSKERELEKAFMEMNRNILSGNAEKISEYLKKYGLENKYALREALGDAADSAMSLTNGRVGYGHARNYMSQKGNKEMEMFAHSIENFFKGNPVFKDLMPDVYEASIDYIEKLLK